MKKICFLFLCVLLIAGCGQVVKESSFPPPSNLTTTGSLGHIILSWEAASGLSVSGYNVYRSTDEANYVKLNSSPIAATGYDDSIPSPAGDGIYYSYKVTAAGSEESGFSNTVKNMHGTRLSANISSGFTTEAGSSPYVAEGNIVVNGGNLTVAAGTKLYVTDNCKIDIEQGDGWYKGAFKVNGLLRVAASTESPATFTSHRVGGTLGDNEGFSLWLDGAVDYNSVNDSGTLVQNAYIKNLRYTNNALVIRSCSPKLYNLKISSDMTAGGGCYLDLQANGGAIIKNCSFNKMAATINADLRSTSFKMDHNIFRGGYYAISFISQANPTINSGQIEYNDFDGSKTAYLYDMTGGQNIPLGNNYWNGGTGNPPLPTVINDGTTSITFDFSPALSTAPADCGPNW